MCDCYGHPCEISGCLNWIQWHIGDYAYPREDFKIWCAKHWRLAPKGATIFRITKPHRLNYDLWLGYPPPRVLGIFISPTYCAAVVINGAKIGEEADNHPNIMSIYKESVL